VAVCKSSHNRLEEMAACAEEPSVICYHNITKPRLPCMPYGSNADGTFQCHCAPPGHPQRAICHFNAHHIDLPDSSIQPNNLDVVVVAYDNYVIEGNSTGSATVERALQNPVDEVLHDQQHISWHEVEEIVPSPTPGGDFSHIPSNITPPMSPFAVCGTRLTRQAVPGAHHGTLLYEQVFNHDRSSPECLVGSQVADSAWSHTMHQKCSQSTPRSRTSRKT